MTKLRRNAKPARRSSPRRALAYLTLALACGCFSSHGPATSTETGNPPVIDAGRVALDATATQVHVTGDKRAVTPGGASLAIKNLATGKVTTAKAAADGSFDVAVDGSANDTFVVSAKSGSKSSDSVYVVQGAAAVADSPSLSCDERAAMLEKLTATVAANVDATCSSDVDCSATYYDSSCGHGCSYAYVSEAGASVLEAETAALVQSVCPSYRAAECPISEASCVGPDPVNCNQGHCMAGGFSLSCAERQMMAGQQFASALSAADKSCAVDADCVIARSPPSCDQGCGFANATSLAGQSAIAAAAARISSDVCGGCPSLIPPCVDLGVIAALTCENQQCKLSYTGPTSGSSCQSCFNQTIEWLLAGGNGPRDHSTLAPCGLYKRERLDPTSSQPQPSCMSNDVACELVPNAGADRQVAVSDAIASAVADSDVQQALTMAPVFFGSPLPPDADEFQITIANRVIDVGGECNSSSMCAIPDGIRALVALLHAIDDHMAAGMDCAVFGSGACPPDRKMATICTQCGPAGGCATQTTTCAKVCGADADCAGDPNGTFCSSQSVCETGLCE